MDTQLEAEAAIILHARRQGVRGLTFREFLAEWQPSPEAHAEVTQLNHPRGYPLDVWFQCEERGMIVPTAEKREKSVVFTLSPKAAKSD